MNIKRVKTLVTSFVSIFKWQKIIPVYKLVDNQQLLEGNVALISGGSGGIGLAIANAFIKSGCKVVLAGTNENKLRTKAKVVGTPYYTVLNVCSPGTFKDVIEKAEKMAGGGINILVNCHGVHTKRSGFDFFNVTEEEYEYVMNINLKGTYFLSQTFANYLIEKKRKGHILNISSQSSLEASWSPYRLSKLGIKGLTEGMAQKLLPFGIVVNSIAPGPTSTDMQDECVKGSIYTDDNPIKRYTTPDEIAEYAKLLVGSLGDTIVGDTLYMSGGRGIIDGK